MQFCNVIQRPEVEISAAARSATSEICPEKTIFSLVRKSKIFAHAWTKALTLWSFVWVEIPYRIVMKVPPSELPLGCDLKALGEHIGLPDHYARVRVEGIEQIPIPITGQAKHVVVWT
jgi:hypothetical protein